MATNSTARTFNIARRLLLLGLAIACLFAGSLPASAISPGEWTLIDSFETTSTWTFDGSSPAAGTFMIGVARTGTKNARLEITANTWKSVGRTVRITPAADQWTWPSDSKCRADFYFRSWTGNLTARIEVIDPATWTYLALSDTTVSQAGYTQVFGQSWNYRAKPNVFVRATIHGPNAETAYVDDLTVTCREAIIG
ncbi:MAG TPA: hypothetical protein VGE07_31560 [Herpetosiphonaceae bacterium]